MDEFRVTAVFPVSYQPNPHVIGHLTGDFESGATVELRRSGQTITHGTLEHVGFHRSPTGEYSFTFCDRISADVQPGDVIRRNDLTDYLVATHGGAAIIESAADARNGRTLPGALIDPDPAAR
ncbi:hypothetical protein [Nocardia sp. AG03]|uniref:hypothetical protein n=1 Tax=Nocardia sp. AG03 TaxID=3025312 RepID=UPI0024183846|nr:hypothetical protein [Nocardia sp. AG03]